MEQPHILLEKLTIIELLKFGHTNTTNLASLIVTKEKYTPFPNFKVLFPLARVIRDHEPKPNSLWSSNSTPLGHQHFNDYPHLRHIMFFRQSQNIFSIYSSLQILR